MASLVSHGAVAFCVAGASRALCSRFESCRTDFNYPRNRQVYQPVFLIAYILSSIIADKRCLIERISILSRRYKKYLKSNSSQSNRQYPNIDKPMIKKS